MNNRKQKSSFIEQADNNGDDGWIWGNSRGGGGAPVRDAAGNTVTNLKPIVHSQDPRSNQRDYSPPLYESPKKNRKSVPALRRNDYEEDEYYEEPRGRRGAPDGPAPGRRIPGLDDPYRGAAAQSNVSPQGSPKKFMSAIQDMNNSSTMQEKLAKQKCVNYFHCTYL